MRVVNKNVNTEEVKEILEKLEKLELKNFSMNVSGFNDMYKKTFKGNEILDFYAEYIIDKLIIEIEVDKSYIENNFLTNDIFLNDDFLINELKTTQRDSYRFGRYTTILIFEKMFFNKNNETNIK